MASNQSGAVLLAFVAGAIAGAAVALLFAPASGDATREYLGQRAREGRSKAMNAFDKARDQYPRPTEGEQEA
jgi:gas vesicle protein